MATFSNLCKTYTIVNRCRTLYNSEIVQGLISAKGTLCVSDLVTIILRKFLDLK